MFLMIMLMAFIVNIKQQNKNPGVTTPGPNLLNQTYEKKCRNSGESLFPFHLSAKERQDQLYCFCGIYTISY